MQVIKENLKRPSLIEPFFNEELTPDNEFISYIDSSNHITNVKNSSVTPDTHNIEKSLKNENQLNILKERLSNCTTVEQVKTLNDEYFFDYIGYAEHAYLFAERLVDLVLLDDIDSRSDKKDNITPVADNSEKSFSNIHGRFSENKLTDYSCPLVPSAMDSDFIYVDANSNIHFFGYVTNFDNLNDFIFFHDYLVKDDDFSIFPQPRNNALSMV